MIVYQDRQFTREVTRVLQDQRDETLNLTSRMLIRFFQAYITTRQALYDSIDTITITSQWRDNSESHRSGKATDITIEPVYLMPYFFCVLHRIYPFNIFLSLHNRHLHIDRYFESAPDRRFGARRNWKMLELATPRVRGNTTVFKPDGTPEVSYNITPPLMRYLTSLTPDIEGTYTRDRRRYNLNIPVFDRYDLQSERSIFLPARRYMPQFLNDAKTRVALALLSEFNKIIPENQKQLLKPESETAIFAREAVRAAGEVIDDIAGIPKTTLVIGVALAAGLFLLSQRRDHNGTEGRDDRDRRGAIKDG